MLNRQSDIETIISDCLSADSDARSVCERVAERIFDIYAVTMENLAPNDELRKMTIDDFWTDTEIAVCKIHLRLPREDQSVLLSVTEYLYVRSNPPSQILSKLPFIILENMLLTDTITESFETWKLLEKTVDFYRENCDKDVFSTTPVKLPILRISNTLLRNISKVQNPLYSGKILMLLNSLYPIWEVSGLSNLKFNSNNSTSIESEADFNSNPTNMTAKLNYVSYKSFWSLQDSLKNFLTNKSPPATILTSIQATLDMLTNTPSVSSGSLEHRLSRSNLKFLTSVNLLQLQLSDPSIRNQILIQIQIVLSLLASPNHSNSLSTANKTSCNNISNQLKSLISPDLNDVLLQSVGEMEGVWRVWKSELMLNAKNRNLVDMVLELQTSASEESKTKRKRPQQEFEAFKISRIDDGGLLSENGFSAPNVVNFTSSYSQCLSAGVDRSDLCHPAGDKVWNWRANRLLRNWDGNLLEMTIQGNFDSVVAALHPEIPVDAVVVEVVDVT